MRIKIVNHQEERLSGIPLIKPLQYNIIYFFGLAFPTRDMADRFLL
jgi:hypothetical protein